MWCDVMYSVSVYRIVWWVTRIPIWLARSYERGSMDPNERCQGWVSPLDTAACLAWCLLACLLGALIELFLANENLPRGSLGVCHFQPLNLDVGDSSALALEDFLPPLFAEIDDIVGM